MQTQSKQIHSQKLIGHGAQAKVYLIEEQNGSRYIVKERLPKKYRHPTLDLKLNVARVKSQTKILQKTYKCGIKVPKVLRTIPEENKIVMEYIDGKKIKDFLIEHPEQAENICRRVGKIIQNLHNLNIIHGDLTTSNMIIKQNSEEKDIYLIDFGLGALTATLEDKAVDLYLFEKAFIATHPQLDKAFPLVLQEYGEISVIQRVQQVRLRGRKRVAFG